MVIIEFAGPSCAGKSTLMRRLEREMREDGFAPRPFTAWKATLRKDLLRAVGNPRIAAWCLLNPRLAVASVGRGLLGVIGWARRVRAEEGVVLLDEGPVKSYHRVPILASRGRSLLLRGMPVPDVLVVVTCDPAERLKRLRETDRSHARGLSDEAILGKTETADVSARRFAGIHDVPVIEIDTSAGSGQLETLKQRLRPYLAAAAPHGSDAAGAARRR